MKFEFRFPDIGEGIHEGTIMKWLVKEGQEVKEGDSLVEVETDKVTTEIPSPRTGRILELKGEVSEVIHVGNVFVVYDLSGDELTDEDKQTYDEEDKVDELEVKQEIVEEETAGVVGEVIASSEMIPPSTEGIAAAPKKAESKKVLATPVARQMAKDLGVDISTVTGTGPNGRVMKEDIQKAKDMAKPDVQVEKPMDREIQKPQVRKPDDSFEFDVESHERTPLTRIRRTIADAMTTSRFTIPHTTAMDEFDITKLDEFRNKYKERLRGEVNLTYLPFIIKAVILALKEFPEFNSQLDEENNELILKYFYHIGIATDTDRGLMVPVVRNADRLSVIEIAKAIEDVSTRAKENKIELSELKGSTFTITNYGSIGGHFGIPIINYPEAAILGLGRIVKKPIVTDNDEIIVAKVLPLSLSYDHRTIDGASGARFLNFLRELLNDPEMLLMKS